MLSSFVIYIYTSRMKKKKHHFLKAQLCFPAVRTTYQVKRYCECILTTYSMQRVFTLAFLCSCREPFQDNPSLYLFETCHCGRVICFLYFISSYICIIHFSRIIHQYITEPVNHCLGHGQARRNQGTLFSTEILISASCYIGGYFQHLTSKKHSSTGMILSFFFLLNQ